LEPSVGRGDLVKYVNRFNKKVKFDCYEIDGNIKFIIDSKNIKIEDFLKSKNYCKYKTIIGNPPYVKTKTGNLYLDFIWKCFCLLCDKGELIFIIPSDFFKLTSSKKILKEMIKEGTFTDIYHPHNETLFKNASIDVLIFRYCKNKDLSKVVLYNDKKMHLIENDGIVTFSNDIVKEKVSIDKYFDIYVGLVSGKENVFKNSDLNNIEILNNQNKIDKYIYITNYPSENEYINKYLLDNKNVLIKRKIKKFNESNWYQWGAPRNIRVMEEKKGTECIYVKNLTRHNTVAFGGNVRYFGGALLIMIPKKKVNIQNVIDYLNSEQFKGNYIYSGRYKIGHKQLSKAYIPKEIL
jgi:adenine-specific DNA-methyltransferase